MSEKLLPCPFCGGEAAFHEYTAAAIEAARRNGLVVPAMAECRRCGAMVSFDDGRYPTRERLAEAWNRRAERTCRMVRARWDDGECVWGCRCTACGDRFTYETGTTWRYCPTCGARVAEEEK